VPTEAALAKTKAAIVAKAALQVDIEVDRRIRDASTEYIKTRAMSAEGWSTESAHLQWGPRNPPVHILEGSADDVDAFSKMLAPKPGESETFTTTWAPGVKQLHYRSIAPTVHSLHFLRLTPASAAVKCGNTESEDLWGLGVGTDMFVPGATVLVVANATLHRVSGYGVVVELPRSVYSRRIALSDGQVF
jgi:hypothetical protein